MGGKAALILILGFTCLMAYTILNLSTAGTRSVDNMSAYAGMTASHSLALAGANVALSRLYRDTTWGSSGPASFTQSFTGYPFTGSFTASASLVPQGKLMRAVSYFPAGSSTYRDTVDVILTSASNNSFSLFAWMTNLENGVFWITGDSIWGRVHSNDNLTVSGSPVFLQKVTTSKGFIPPLGKTQKIGGVNYTNKAIFINPPQPETGVARVDLPTDMSGIAAAANSPTGRKYTTDIWVTLDGGSASPGDGVAYVRQTKTGPIIDTVRISDPNFNGVIMGTGVVNVQGTLDGALTIASYNLPTGLTNNIVIQGDLLYQHDPRLGPSNDMLGLCANNSVIVADDIAGATSRTIDASIFARTGSFTAENYSTRPINGELRVLGSIVQNSRGAVGTFNGSSTLQSGFYKRYKFDDRLADPNVRPPSYPGFIRRAYTITQWWESYHVMSFN
ncbi:MAG TPA: hypothetical protein VMF59_15680 [Bacteroidota bacterium]|nr:hypothetical protein [Bacteroidota bacterium]